MRKKKEWKTFSNHFLDLAKHHINLINMFFVISPCYILPFKTEISNIYIIINDKEYTSHFLIIIFVEPLFYPFYQSSLLSLLKM